MPFFRRKKKAEASGGEKEDKKDDDNKMPLFRRQSEKCRKRMQDQELLAQQDPEPRFDMSACELAEVPSGVYAICRVLQKQVLLLQDNWLHSLSGGGELADLKLIRVLDLHNNELKSLPDDFGCLENLQVLDLSSNKLKTLPKSFDQLSSMQTLNIRNNRFKSLPDPVCELKCLRTLDISHNEIEGLPLKLCYVKSLETLILDVDKMKYPSPDICKKSTAAIMMYLCGEAETEYEHPSKYWLKVEAASKGLKSSASDDYLNIARIESQMMEGVQAYQSVLDQKRKDAEELERVLYAEQEAQAQLAVKAAADHRLLLSCITQNQEQDSKDLRNLSSRKEAEKKEFIKYLKDFETGASGLLTRLLDYNKKAKETEELLGMMEEERMKEDDWFSVRWEELQNVRKREVLDNMKIMLTEFASMEAARKVVEGNKDETRRDALEQATLDVGNIESLMYYKDLEHKKMVKKLAKEEELQKAAFEALMFSQDSAHSRIRSQIVLIESELAQITAIEMEQRAERMENEFNVVADQRIALSAMLSQLLEEKEKRQSELKKRLLEMEQQREDGQQDYWLVQYQRLLDRKPQALIDRESQLEIAVKEILITAGAEEYLPLFARHRITIETLVTLTDDDLKQMGVHQMGLRRSILKHAEQESTQVKPAEEKVREKIREPVIPSHDVEPTAPPPSAAIGPPSLPPSLTERQLSVTARGINSECAICLDKPSNVIFLTCGHVCCCVECSQPIKECPLCRSTITARIKISLPAPTTGS